MDIARNFVTGLFFTTSLFASFLPAAASNDRSRVEVAFVLDTTGSMAGLIDGAKRKIWSIANTIVDINPDAEIRMALIGYRDRDDEYVIESHDMSSDLQGLYGKLIRFEADGGGDPPESVNEALDAAIRKLSWDRSDNTRRIVFLVGDAPPHMDYDNAPQYPDVLKIAKQRGITVNAVQAGDDPDTESVWKDIAQRGHGAYIPIPQDGGEIVIVETPFDTDIIELQRRIDRTVIPYGDREQQEEVRSKLDTRSMAPASVSVDNSEFYAKRRVSKEVITGGGDLVADIKNGVQQLDKVTEDGLPEEMKTQSSGERQAFIEQKIAEREKLEKQMVELVQKRDDYKVEQAKTAPEGNKDSFDQVVADTLRAQLR